LDFLGSKQVVPRRQSLTSPTHSLICAGLRISAILRESSFVELTQRKSQQTSSLRSFDVFRTSDDREVRCS